MGFNLGSASVSASLATLEADTAAMVVDLAALEVDLAAIEVELLDQGTSLDAMVTDLAALEVDLAAIEVELLDQGTSLDAMVTDLAAIEVDLAAIETEQLAQGVSLDAMVTDLAAIEVLLTGIDADTDAINTELAAQKVSQVSTLLQWAAADTKSVAFGATETSDALTFNTRAKRAVVQLKADNAGTPAAGDTVTFSWIPSCGDPDGAVTDEFDTVETALPIATINTNLVDPAIVTVEIPAVTKSMKIAAKSNAASNSITVSGRVIEILN